MPLTCQLKMMVLALNVYTIFKAFIFASYLLVELIPWYRKSHTVPSYRKAFEMLVKRVGVTVWFGDISLPGSGINLRPYHLLVR